MEAKKSKGKDCPDNASDQKSNSTTKDADQQELSSYADNLFEERTDLMCGIGSFHPTCLTPCTNMYCFVFFYSLAGLSTSTLSSYITSQITALERQFGFSSAESGFLLACNDIGFLLTVLFISYYLRNGHAPRWLSFLTGLFGISGLICALPYFLGSTNEGSRKIMETMDNNGLDVNFTKYQRDYEYMCHTQPIMTVGNNEEGGADAGGGSRYSHWKNTLALVILANGMVLQGAAKSGRSPLITSYVDNNVKKTQTGKYIGIITSVSILAPSVSFSSATIFSRLYFTLEETDLTPEDPRWIGAWWLGFLVFGCVSLIVMLPVMLFPRKLPGKNKRNEIPLKNEITRTNEIILDHKPKRKSSENVKNMGKESKKKVNISSLKRSFLGFLKSLIRIIRHVPYVLITAAISVKVVGIAGIFSFNAKYLEAQFFLPAWKSNALMGMIKLLALSSGTLLGGIFTSKLKISARGSLAMITVVHVLSGFIESLYLIAGCELPPIVGPDTVPFRNPAPAEHMMPECVTSCSCDEHRFLPVCFNNTITYFSPCFAGCQDKNGTMYTDCKCLPAGTTVASGICDTGCNSLYYYIAIATMNAFIGTMLIVPTYIANLRIAGDEDKSLAVGMSTFFSSLIGWMSGPVIFGMIVDSACLVWNSSSEERGFCTLYENRNLKNYMFITRTALTFAAAVLTFLAFLVQTRDENKQKRQTEGQERAEKELEVSA